MRPIDFLRHPMVFLTITFHDFVHWYFLEMPVKIVKTYINYFLAFNEIFSFWFLLKTLFSPWRQIYDKYEVRGFNFTELAQSFTLNCTTRIIGFIFRAVALTIGTIAQTIIFMGFTTYFLAWMFFPALFVLGIYLIYSRVFGV